MNSPDQHDDSLKRIRSRGRELLLISDGPDTADAETLAAFVDGTLALDAISEATARRWIDLLGADALISDRLQAASDFLVPSEDTKPSPALNKVIIPSERLHSGVVGTQPRSFDESYVERLCGGDFRTQEHFVAYFAELIQLKLRSRLHSPQAIEDVRQETFARVFSALRSGHMRQPDRLGAFVNSICNNVLLEHYRASSRDYSLDEGQQGFPTTDLDAIETIAKKQIAEKVQEILKTMPERDRRLLREVFLAEREKDEVCSEFGVDRDYLRVLLNRARQLFKGLYLKNVAARLPGAAPVKKR